MNRKEELDNIFKDIDENEKKLVQPLIQKVIFWEHQMLELEKLPFICTNPKNPMQQKKTEASKLHKEISQSYMNAIRILCSLIHKVDSNEDSPLRQYLNGLEGKYD